MSEVPLRDYVQQIVDEKEKRYDQSIRELEKRMDQAFVAVREAVEKAEGAQLRVNLSQNEFRGALTDLSATFATREYADAKLTEGSRRLTVIERWQAKVVGGMLVAQVAIAITVAFAVRAFTE